MDPFRRLYQYAVSLVSLLVLTWSTIALLRTLLAGSLYLSSSSLAAGLASILVSAPVFVGHWRWAQREAAGDPQARESTLRALFFFVILTALLLPVVHNTLALLGRLLHQVLTVGGNYFGQGDTTLDNLIAIAVNLAWVAYFAPKTRHLEGEHLPVVRRLYRYFWTLYGLGFLASGVALLIQSLMTTLGSLGGSMSLVNGLSLAVVGAVVWGSTWRTVQQSIAVPEERGALLRAGLLYVLSLVGLIGLLAPLGVLLYHLLLVLLGATYDFADWITALRAPVSVGVPLGGIWWYYRRTLLADVRHLPPTAQRDDLQRLYRYVLAFIGLSATFVGVFGLLTFLVKAIDNQAGMPVREELAGALSTTLIGLPLWGFTWRTLLAESSATDEAGERARRSRIRKGYLYLVTFLGTIGGMYGTGALIYHLLEAALGNLYFNLGAQLLHDVKSVLMFGALLGYHVGLLRQDSHRRAEALRARYAKFPVLILTHEHMGDLVPLLTAAIEQTTDNLPVAVHAMEAGAPDAALSAAKAVILPADWATTAPEALLLWIKGFEGHKVLLPPGDPSWIAVGASPERPGKQARMAAEVIRRLAEGTSSPAYSRWPAWAWVLLGLGGLMLINFLISLLISLVNFL